MQHPRVKSFLNTRSHGEFFSKFKIVYVRLCKSAAISEKWDVFMYEILWSTSTRTEKSLLSIKTSVSCKRNQSMPNFNEIKTENRDPDGDQVSRIQEIMQGSGYLCPLVWFLSLICDTAKEQIWRRWGTRGRGEALEGREAKYMCI